MSLSTSRWASIQLHQDAELRLILSDRVAAEHLASSPVFARIGEWLPPGTGGRVLELGCGPGRFVALLAQLGYDVVGIDPVPYEQWQQIRGQFPVTLRHGVKAEQLPFEDGEFDNVACMGALLYFEDPHRAAKEIHRVMKPGGRLVVRTVNRRNIYTLVTGRKLDPASHNLYSEQELRSFLSLAGFTVERSFTFGFWPPACTQYWWYLVNGIIPQKIQLAMSRLTPPANRLNVTVFATRA